MVLFFLFPVESFYDFTMVPLVSPDDVSFAVLVICHDVTHVHLQQRRIELLSKLAARSASAQTVEGVCHSFASTIRATSDLPWMAIYADDACDNRKEGEGEEKSKKAHQKSFRLVATSFDENLQRDAANADLSNTSTSGSIKAEVFFDDSSKRTLPDWLPALPPTVKLPSSFRNPTSMSTATEEPLPSTSTSFSPTRTNSPTPSFDRNLSISLPTRWPFTELSYDTPYLIVSTPTPTNPHGESVIMPITTQSAVNGDRKLLGIMVAGLNQNKMLDDKYYKFFENVANQLESAILNGRARGDDRRAAESLRRLNQYVLGLSLGVIRCDSDRSY